MLNFPHLVAARTLGYADKKALPTGAGCLRNPAAYSLSSPDTADLTVIYSISILLDTGNYSVLATSYYSTLFDIYCSIILDTISPSSFHATHFRIPSHLEAGWLLANLYLCNGCGGPPSQQITPKAPTSTISTFSSPLAFLSQPHPNDRKPLRS